MKALIIMALLILSASFVTAQIQLNSSECTDFTYDYFNLTDNTTSSVSQGFCCQAQENATCTNTTEIIYQNVSVNRCEASASLSSGSTFNRDDASCLLDFSCQTCTQDTCPEAPACPDTNISDYINQQVTVDIEKSGSTFKVTALNISKNYDLNISFYTDSIGLTLTCPVIYSGGAINDTTNIEWTYNNCKQWVDMFDSRNFMAYDTYAKYLQSNTKDTLDFQKGLMEGEAQFRNQLVDCQQKLLPMQTLQTNLQNSNDHNLGDDKTIKDLESERTGLVVIVFILLLVSIIFIGIWVTNGGLDGGVEVQ